MPIESRNPADDDTLLGALNIALLKHLQTTDDLLPAKVVDYDRATNRATVQPLIQILDTDNQRHQRAQNTNIPVLLIGSGTFFVSFHIPPGSLGWIKANDRDISLFLQNVSTEEVPPNTLRMHSFEDAFFIPDVMAGYTIADEDQQAMVIQNLSGSVRISLNEQRIKLTAPAVEIMGPTTITGATTIEGDTAINGMLTNNGVNVGSTHTHQYNPGPGSPAPTGVPQ